MKLKYLFSAILASVLLLAGCVQEPIGTFEDIKLSSTNVSIPVEGGEVSVTLTTTKDWAFVTTDLWPNVIAYKTVDDKEVVDEENTEPSWLKLEGPMEGTAGEHTLKFSAEVVSGGRDLTLEIKAGSHSQYITIRQGTKAVENATCADVIAGVDGKVYRVTGVCTKIANDLYGNWYLEDGTGEVYVYGTLDKDGATKNFASWKMAVGDIVTVEGPRKDYNGTIELVDVTVLNIEKSLLKIEEKPEAIAKEGGEYQLTLLYKGLGVQPSVPAVDADGESVDYREWISVVDVETKFAEATKLDPNPADTALVTIKVLPNEGGARNGIINFTSGTDEASSTVSFEFTQEGSIAEVTVADFLAKEKGDALYKLTGKVSGLKPGDYGNFHLVDATGSVYVYGLTATPVAKNDKSFPTLGIREGDIVTLIGKRDRYDDAKVPEEKEQVGGPAYYVSHIGSTDVTVAEFLQKPESSDVRYRITGTVANIQMDKNDPTKESAYGNFDLVDGDASVLVYGLTVAPVEKNDLSFPKLGLKAGDVVTIVGTRTAFKGTPQVGGPAYYIAHTPGDTPGETPGEGGEGGEGGEEPSEKAARNLAFSSATATATLGEAFTAPTLSGEAAGVVYTSSNTEVATVDATTGAVTLVAAGETTITANAAETETLLAGTASYTLTVSAEEVTPSEPTLADGKYWIVGTKGGVTKVMTPLAADRAHGYPASEALVNNTSYLENAFTFTAVAGGYTIQDQQGRYYFNESNYKTFNAGTDGTLAACVWTIAKGEDNTYTIVNNETGKQVLYADGTYTSFGVYGANDANSAVAITLMDASGATARPVLNIANSSAAVDAETTTHTIELESNLAWTATATEGVTLSPASGNGNASVVMTFAANTGETALTYTVTFTAGDLTKTFTLTHKAPANGGQSTDPVTLSIKIEDLVKENNYTVSAGQIVTNYKNLSLDSVISMVAGGSANNEGSFWDSGRQWRIYQTGGGKVTVSAIDGYTIQSVKFTYTVSNTGILKTTSGNLESGTVDTVNSSSVTYTVGNTGSATNGQVRITAVEVVYQAN